MMFSEIRRNRFFVIMLFVYLIYASLFIIQTSHVAGGERYFILFDDAMISMQYAKNLASGNGLVWNQGGEKVEGFTNFLWVIIMTVPHLAGLALSKTSLFIQMLGLILMLTAALITNIVSMKLTQNNRMVSFFASFLVLFYHPLNYWSLMGTETGLVALLMLLSVFFVLKSHGEKRIIINLYPVYVLLLLTRPDTLIFIILISVYSILYVPERKKQIMYSSSVILFTLVSMTLFRFFYYGELLPNTYYLKITGYPVMLRVLKGLWAAFHTFSAAKVAPLLIPFVAAFFIRKKEYLLLVAVFLVQLLYSIYVGGDAWESAIGANRFISAALPLYFITVSAGVYYFVGRYVKQGNKKIVFSSIMIVLLVALNSYSGINSLKQSMLMEKQYHTDSLYGKLIRGMFVNYVTSAKAKIGVFWAGTVPYFAGRECVDLLGKNNKRTARFTMKRPGPDASFMEKVKYFYPGHMKNGFMDTDKLVKMDMITDILKNDKAFINYVKNDYYYLPMMVFVRKDSEMIYWDRLQELIESAKK